MLKDVLEFLGKLLVWWLVAFGVFALLIMQCSQKTEASVTITDVIYAIEEVESNHVPLCYKQTRKCVRLFAD